MTLEEFRDELYRRYENARADSRDQARTQNARTRSRARADALQEALALLASVDRGNRAETVRGDLL